MKAYLTIMTIFISLAGIANAKDNIAFINAKGEVAIEVSQQEQFEDILKQIKKDAEGK